MNKKIIAIAAAGIIAIGIYANSPSGEKVVFDNNPIVQTMQLKQQNQLDGCLLYTSPSPRDSTSSRMPSSA